MQGAEYLASSAVAAQREDFSVDVAPEGQVNVSVFRKRGIEGSETNIAWAVLCIHGLAANRRVFDEICICLVGQRCVCASVDLRGHGDSGPNSTEPSMEQFSGDLTAVLHALRQRDPLWDKHVVVLGHSYGGNLALRWVHMLEQGGSANNVAAVFLLDGGYINLAGSFTAGWLECRQTLLPRPFGVSLSELPEALRSWFPKYSSMAVNAMLQNFIAGTDEDNEGLAVLRLNTSEYEAILQDLWNHPPDRFAPKASVFMLPTDDISPFSQNKENDVQALASKLPNATITWLRGETHQVPLENPSRVISCIVEILSQLQVR